MEKHIYDIIYDVTNVKVGEIYYNPDTDKYRAIRTNKEPLLPTILFGLPPEIVTEQTNSNWILFWLKDRVIPENRDNIKELLQIAGLDHYDWK